MTQTADDAKLLSEYVLQGSREALGELARRYTDLVYSAARRQLRDPHLAEDVTQVVFMLLSSKAHTILKPALLAGWLYKATHYACANAMKMENRRKHHERRAAAEVPLTSETQDADWTDVGPQVDSALSKLNSADRDAILLRYFQGKSLAEVASAMDITTEAARKRVTRAVEKLRALLKGRALAVSAVGLGGLLSAHSVEAAPAVLHDVVGRFCAGQADAVSANAMRIAHRMTAPVSRLVPMVAIAFLALLSGIVWLVIHSHKPSPPPVRSDELAAVPEPILARDAETEKLPIASGWPIALPGAVMSSPMAADLDGDGKLEVIVTCMESRPSVYMNGSKDPIPRHPRTDPAARIYAFHFDGTPVPGWPVEIMSAEDHLLTRRLEPERRNCEDWFSSPSIADVNGDGRDDVVIARPNGPNKQNRGVSIVYSDATAAWLPTDFASPSPNGTIPLVDIDGDGVLDMVAGGLVATVRGAKIESWKAETPDSRGLSACIGDADGDGVVEIYWSSKESNGQVVAFDPTGALRPGWPQVVGEQMLDRPSMGNVWGDEKMEIIVPDMQNRLLAWTCDGKPLGRTKSDDASVPAVEAAVFKINVKSCSPPALADLDGDGLAEIIIYDCLSMSLRAWHGDGRGVRSADGTITMLMMGEVSGVSVADLDGDGEMDFFVGAAWVRLAADGKVSITTMLPGNVETLGQDTIADLDGDGTAEILIGASDGRVAVYHTGKRLRSEWTQWPTAGGDSRHTGCWHRRS